MSDAPMIGDRLSPEPAPFAVEQTVRVVSRDLSLYALRDKVGVIRQIAPTRPLPIRVEFEPSFRWYLDGGRALWFKPTEIEPVSVPGSTDPS